MGSQPPYQVTPLTMGRMVGAVRTVPAGGRHRLHGPQPLDPRPQTPDPKPQTPNPKPHTPNPNSQPPTPKLQIRLRPVPKNAGEEEEAKWQLPYVVDEKQKVIESSRQPST